MIVFECLLVYFYEWPWHLQPWPTAWRTEARGPAEAVVAAEVRPREGSPALRGAPWGLGRSSRREARKKPRTALESGLFAPFSLLLAWF